MDTLVYPVYILVRDNGGVIEFPTRVAMQGFLEAIDIENNEYEAWDANGHLLELSVGKPKSEWLRIRQTQNIMSETEFKAIRERAEKRPVARRWFGSLLKGPKAKS